MPGIGLVIDGAMQQAAQCGLQETSGDALTGGKGKAGCMCGLSAPVARLGEAA
jgi:hypothetical protein